MARRVGAGRFGAGRVTVSVRLAVARRQTGEARVTSVTVVRRAVPIARPVDAARVVVTVKCRRRSTVTWTARDAVTGRGDERRAVGVGRGEMTSRTTARASKRAAAVPVSVSRRVAGA